MPGGVLFCGFGRDFFAKDEFLLTKNVSLGVKKNKKGFC
jgi:hypothetical protein